MTTATKATTRQDVYTRVTDQIIEPLEQGVRPWLQPWNARHAAGKRAIFTAASHASQAVDYLHGLQPQPVE